MCKTREVRVRVGTDDGYGNISLMPEIPDPEVSHYHLGQGLDRALHMTPGQSGTLTWELDEKSVRPYKRPKDQGNPYACGACGASYDRPSFICITCETLNRGEPLPWPEPQELTTERSDR